MCAAVLTIRKTILSDSVSVPISRKKLICSSAYPSNGDFSGLKSLEIKPISDFTNFFDKFGFLLFDWSSKEQNADAKMSLVKLFEQTFVASRSGLIIGLSFSGKYPQKSRIEPLHWDFKLMLVRWLS